MKIVLGSASPRRKILLSTVIDKFEIIHPNIDEKKMGHESPEDYSERISIEKSNSILSSYTTVDYPLLIITSDTIVTIDRKILGKPDNFDEAARTLSTLKGRTHNVISSITLQHIKNINEKKHLSITGSEVTEVKFRDLTENDIVDYLNSIEYKDKAGAYAYQENGERIIENIRGSVTNVIGFPLRLFYRLINKPGIINEIF